MNVDSHRALLRRFEPVIRYTRGERFFPIDIEPYIRACSLWMQQPGQEAICLVPEEQLTLEKLCIPLNYGTDTIYFLKFIEPLNIRNLASHTFRQGFLKRDPKQKFRAGRGRLARVGYLSRFIDAIFSITLLARGRVPGDTAAAATIAYQKLLDENARHCYYGRVVQQNDWIALQYWFFYPFNNWRSGFYGVNDHEADWEMAFVYLSESDHGEVNPEWVAYGSHDFSGDDLRRRWDDPELEKSGEHPVIYVGAGSHASYFSPGEYLAEIELPFLSPLVRMTGRFQSSWQRTLHLGQSSSGQSKYENDFNIFRIPFVDYARGDGISIGPGCDIEWDEPHFLSPPPEWALKYRGLWGLYTRDPISGENAPAGPVYMRDGAVRRSWYDPLGWSGLDKVPPPNKALAQVPEIQKEIETRRSKLTDVIAEKSEELTHLGMEASAIQEHQYLRKLYTEHKEKINLISDEINNLRTQYISDSELLEALENQAEHLRQGERGPARAHIHRAHHPASDADLQLSRFAEAWAAVSIGIIMLGFLGIILFARHYLIWGIIAMATIIPFIEASFRRQLTRLITRITSVLAITSALILLYEFFWEFIVMLVIIVGGYIMWENLRELRA